VLFQILDIPDKLDLENILGQYDDRNQYVNYEVVVYFELRLLNEVQE